MKTPKGHASAGKKEAAASERQMGNASRHGPQPMKAYDEIIKKKNR
ncbi:MAG: hypothetical protein J6V90_06730 [Treponema sp.]|nr:hypothetical protein [Treponema sp.]